LVAASNNYTEDNILNKRLAFSAAYNTSINGLNFAAPAAGTGGDAVVTLTNYTVLDHLDALFIRTNA